MLEPVRMTEQLQQQASCTFMIVQRIWGEPMSYPLVSSRGPHELQGLMDASVWITFYIGRAVFHELISIPARE